MLIFMTKSTYLYFSRFRDLWSHTHMYIMARAHKNIISHQRGPPRFGQRQKVSFAWSPYHIIGGRYRAGHIILCPLAGGSDMKG